MSINNKKYLDYAGLEKLKSLKAVVPHPITIEKSEAAYKVAINADGHIVSSSPLTPADLGLDNALHFVGISTKDPLAAEGAQIPGYSKSFIAGDVCIYQRSGETGYEEYIYTGTVNPDTGSAWELLGDADSHALKSITHSSTDDYILIDGTAKGSADHSKSSTISHKSYTAADPAVKSIGRDAGGHVVIGKDILVQSGGGGSHDHDVEITIPKDTYVTEVTDTHTKLSVSASTAKVLTGIEDKLANLDTTSIRGVSGSTEASKANAGTAIEVAKAGAEVVYGEANVGTEVTGLAKRAASKTTVGNANIATSATIIGNADVGAATRYGTANVGEAVKYGTANVGDAVTVATRAASQTTVGNANVATAATNVGNADVGAAVVYGTADVGTEVTVDAGQADVGKAVVYGTANVGTAIEVATIATAKSTFLTGVTASAPTTTVTPDKTVYNADVDEDDECLILSPVTITASTTAPALTPTTGDVQGVSGTVSITPAVSAPATQTLTPAVASNRTVSFTPARAADTNRTLTPAVKSNISIYGAVSSETKIYAVGGVTDITPAVESNTTLTPAVAAPATQTLTPAAAATNTIYGAVESTTKIYGVTDDQVSIIPAVQSTKKIVPAVANGTITPYTFDEVTVPVAAEAATTVATGSVSVGGAGAAIMTGTETTDTTVLNGATIVKGTTGDVDVVDEVTATKNAAATFDGTTDSHAEGTHTHILYTE
jgi:hypothetical protein